MVQKGENNAKERSASLKEEADGFDFTAVSAHARIAVYDDFLSAPRVVLIEPAQTAQFIENIASETYRLAGLAGGKIPYTVIREVSENFIHAHFQEVTVSIFDQGNTIRFTDQGPGISQKEKVLLPGYTSAVEPMKHYIRGVGSGLPIVKEYLSLKEGSIQIDDNLGSGAVVTISLVPEHQQDQPQRAPFERPTPPQTPLFSRPDIPFREPAFANEAYQAEVAQIPALTAKGFPSSPRYGDIPPNSSLQGGMQLSVAPGAPLPNAFPRMPLPVLSQREQDILFILAHEGVLGITELSNLSDIPISSVYKTLDKLEQAGLVEKDCSKKRMLSEWGKYVSTQYLR